MTNLPERPDGTPPVCAHTALAPTCAQDPLAKSGASSISDKDRGKITKPSMRQAALTSVAFTQSMCLAALSCATEQRPGRRGERTVTSELATPGAAGPDRGRARRSAE